MKIRRSLSVILALVFMLSTMFAFSFSAAAEADVYDGVLCRNVKTVFCFSINQILGGI